ncbi:MAG: alanyl-tRNA editing protein [Bryobacteraceae bacterium]|nr:alanyl-tRNA editing protein [Bryobacteraceae bacterium]
MGVATRKLFWEDPYRTSLDTRIRAVAGDEVSLDETILYALSGGQESDAGTINGLPVLAARKEGLDIWYRLPAAFTAGEAVQVKLDWPRRYALMRLHFAAELVLELTYRARPGIEKIGAHIDARKSRIDFLLDEPITPLLPSLTRDAQALIDARHPITSAFSHEATQRRYWEIEGFARVSCGGTHPRHTGEVGQLKLKRNNIGKGKERIEIYADPPGPA